MSGRTPSNRPGFKAQISAFPIELLLVLAAMALIILALAGTARAEMALPAPTPAKAHRHTSTMVTTDKDEEVDDSQSASQPSTPEPTEKIITAKFGSKPNSGTSGCKTEDVAKNVIRELKSDCAAWLKDRKAELKGKYLTGSCEESCDDCGMDLRRCNVEGSVHYTTTTAK